MSYKAPDNQVINAITEAKAATEGLKTWETKAEAFYNSIKKSLKISDLEFYDTWQILNFTQGYFYSPHLYPLLIKDGFNFMDDSEHHNRVIFSLDCKKVFKEHTTVRDLFYAYSKSPKLSPEERKIVKLIGDLFIKCAAFATTEEVMNKLRQLWEVAYHLQPNIKDKIPKTVLDMLSPLADPKRSDKVVTYFINYDLGKLKGIKDLVEEFANHVVIPQAFIEYSRATGQPFTHAMLQKLCPKPGFQRTTTEYDFSTILHVTTATLMANCSLDKVIGLNEAYHDPDLVFPDNLKPYQTDSEWHSLTMEKVTSYADDPEITLCALTSSEELRQEGTVMEHCVGGGNYATRCLKGDTHIISIRKKGLEKPISTVELKEEGGRYKIIQNQDFKNNTPSPIAETAINWFVDGLNSRSIDTSFRSGETKESKSRNKLSPLARSIGFEITQYNVDQAFDEFANNPKRRGRVYDKETKNFDAVSRQSELITGGFDSPSGITLPFKSTGAEQWFKSSGLYKIVTPFLAAEIDRCFTANASVAEDLAKLIKYPIVAVRLTKKRSATFVESTAEAETQLTK